MGNEEKKVVKASTKKVQKVSATYTLKAMRENVKKLGELNLLIEAEIIELGQYIDKAVDRWIKEEFGQR